MAQGRTEVLEVSHPRRAMLTGGERSPPGACPPSQGARLVRAPPARRWRAALWGGVLAWCEYSLLAVGEQSQVGLLAKVEQLPGQALAEGKRLLPPEGEQLICSLGEDPSRDPPLMVLVCSSLLSSRGW